MPVRRGCRWPIRAGAMNSGSRTLSAAELWRSSAWWFPDRGPALGRVPCRRVRRPGRTSGRRTSLGDVLSVRSVRCHPGQCPDVRPAAPCQETASRTFSVLSGNVRNVRHVSRVRCARISPQREVLSPRLDQLGLSNLSRARLNAFSRAAGVLSSQLSFNACRHAACRQMRAPAGSPASAGAAMLSTLERNIDSNNSIAFFAGVAIATLTLPVYGVAASRRFIRPHLAQSR
jgi:hypothetical protein